MLKIAALAIWLTACSTPTILPPDSAPNPGAPDDRRVFAQEYGETRKPAWVRCVHDRDAYDWVEEEITGNWRNWSRMYKFDIIFGAPCTPAREPAASSLED